MPDGRTTQVDETATPEAQAVTTGATAELESTDFETWLAGQPDKVRKQYESHVGGLKSALDKERKANQKRDAEAAKKQKEAEDAQLSEVERLKKQIAELSKEREELSKAQLQIAARDALLAHAEKIGLVFATKVAEQDTIRFALESVEITDDGKVSNADKVLRAIVEERPYLIKPAQATTGTTNAAARGNGKQVDPKAREQELKQRYNIR